MYVLTNVSQNTDGMVYAGTPTFFETEEAAITSAKEQLADDYGISLEEVDYSAQEGGTPYVLSMSQDGRFEGYTVSRIPDAKSIKVETPEGFIVVEVKGANDDYPGVYITTQNNGAEELIACAEFDTVDKRTLVSCYCYGNDNPVTIINAETGDDQMY